MSHESIPSDHQPLTDEIRFQHVTDRLVGSASPLATEKDHKEFRAIGKEVLMPVIYQSHNLGQLESLPVLETVDIVATHSLSDGVRTVFTTKPDGSVYSLTQTREEPLTGYYQKPGKRAESITGSLLESKLSSVEEMIQMMPPANPGDQVRSQL